MKPFRITATLLAAAAFTVATGAFADPMTAPPPGERAGQGGDQGPDAGPGPGERRGPGGHGPRHGGDGPGFHVLRGIELTEAQQDRLFAILHAQAPQQRELDKAEHKAHEALRAMREAGEYDEAKAAVHTRALGRAIAARALLRVRSAGQAMALLTPQQRAHLQAERKSRQ